MIPNKNIFRLLIFLFSVYFSSTVVAQEFSSGVEQVPLIELYTSEGCSSCPPADKWMSTLRFHESLWAGFVPIALHVDYWDYIGWKDPFASREYSQRQRQIAAENNERTVYTPGVRKAGEEWRTWRSLKPPTLDKAPHVGKLFVSLEKGGVFKANFDSSLANTDLQLNIAILGLGLTTQVERGENRGKTLEHDFVVLGLSRFASAELNTWSGLIEQPPIEAGRYALAAWVSEKGRTLPVQATGGYLENQIWLSPSRLSNAN